MFRFPAPLPGYETAASVQSLANNSFKLINSLRMREADAGGMLLALVFDKYVWQLGWHLELASADGLGCTVAKVVTAPVEGSNAALSMVQQVVALARRLTQHAIEDALVASQQNPVFGTLLALR